MIEVRRAFIPLAALAACACSGEPERNEEAEAGTNSAAVGALEAPEEAALLAQDPELANESAADETADVEAYGGNAAAMGSNGQ